MSNIGLVNNLAEGPITIHSRRYEYQSWLPDNSSISRIFSLVTIYTTQHIAFTRHCFHSSIVLLVDWILCRTLLFPVAGNDLRCYEAALTIRVLVPLWLCSHSLPLVSSIFPPFHSLHLCLLPHLLINFFLVQFVWLVLIITTHYGSYHRKPRWCDPSKVTQDEDSTRLFNTTKAIWDWLYYSRLFVLVWEVFDSCNGWP